MSRTARELDQDLVHYRCVSRDHRAALWAESGITIHNGRWAYCPAGSMISNHRWTETGGVLAADIRAAQEECDSTLLSLLSAAETFYNDIGRAIGVTTLRLEVTRPGAPLSVDVGERWSLLGRAMLELELRDDDGRLGRALIGDDRRDDYCTDEREIARRIVKPHVPILRRWVSAQGAR